MLLAGCTQSVEQASDDYCTDLESLQAEVASLGSIVGGSTTLDDIDAQRQAVASAYDATASSADDLDAAVSSAAESAYSQFRSTVEAIPGDATLVEAAAQYAEAARTYTDSLATIAADAGCGDAAQ